jgi:hypothetical protein
MAIPTTANYVFLPWVRQGAASGIETPDSLEADQPGVVSVPVKLRINDTDDIEQQVRLYGPGDITGIDTQQVVRTEPRHLATDFEPNYFPAIEFDRPDFPWLFTPAKATTDGKLRPWLCLVVVQKQEGVELRTERNLPLPVLEIEARARPERELPDISEAWAWAHVQVMGSPRDETLLRKALGGDPALTVSRLLCPRRLDPETEYWACLVPAFELGRKAGLGESITTDDEKKLEPAWASGALPGSPVILPVYFHWEFRTGAGGDFEELVRLLEPRPMPEEAGKRRMDISAPGFQITPSGSLPPGTMLEIEGALRVLGAPTAKWPQATRTPFQEALKRILNAPWQAMKEEGHEPLLAPPIYGCWQAAQHTVEIAPEPGGSAEAPAPAPRWLHELNLDPRNRAVAALGTQVVQTQQEQLMASAWEQLGEIERVNQMRRQAQLARAVNAVFYAQHFANFSAEVLLKVAAPAQSRVVVELTSPNNGKTRALLSHTISQSAMPDRAVSAPLRRMTSPRGAINTRFRASGARPGAIMARLNNLTPVVPVQRKPAGWVTINQVSDQADAGLRPIVRFERVSSALETPPQLSDFKVFPELMMRSVLDFKPGLPLNADTQAFLNAAGAHQDYINQRVFATIWQNYKFVFSGGNGIVYGVDHAGRLRFHRDPMQDGTPEATNPSIIGQGGWLQFKFLFSGGNGIIYAVNPEGKLLFFRDKTQNGTGDVANPTIIGQGGWLQFKFLFSGGNGIIYAVNPEGKLLFFRDQVQNGTGDVANPTIIGQGGWQNFEFLFGGGKGILNAVDVEGRLLISRDETQDGTGNVPNPSVVNPGDEFFLAPPMDLSQTKDALLRSINPERTIKARVQASLVLGRGGTAQSGDPLEPILDAPEFPHPMYEGLADLSQDFLFPGLEHVPPNTVTLLETNPKFVESFLVGLNAEMSHEMLWRGYPTDQRGTYFRQFWDAAQADIDRISAWGDAELGENAHAGESLVLLIRGALLRRYPNSVIYAVKAEKINGKLDLSRNVGDEFHPLFRGTLKPDVTFLGFDLTREDAIKDPGWFFVIQEQPTEPRFGLDVAEFAKPLPDLNTTWNALTWRHLADTEDTLKALSHASFKPKPEFPVIDNVQWGKSSAHQAYITLQRPVRVAIHARELIPQG